MGRSWVPVSEAALLLRVSRQRVYQLIDGGQIVARKHNSTWLVSQSSIDQRISYMASVEAAFTGQYDLGMRRIRGRRERSGGGDIDAG